MVQEVLELLCPHADGTYCDCTVGLAGHACALLDACGPTGMLIGVDRDEEALAFAASRLVRFDPARWSLHHASFADLDEVVHHQRPGGVDGLLADLGVSSMQLDDPSRGFSFTNAGPVDMRMDRTSPGTALDVIRGSSPMTLERILCDYGEERHARRIARHLHEEVRRGRILDTRDLAQAVREASGRVRSGGVDAATRTFMAIRLAVNRELDQLQALLARLAAILAPGGVFVCLAYHSLEDRLVKRGLRALAAAGVGEILTARPLTPSMTEVRRNRRARSAKLRAFRKTGR